MSKKRLKVVVPHWGPGNTVKARIAINVSLSLRVPTRNSSIPQYSNLLLGTNYAMRHQGWIKGSRGRYWWAHQRRGSTMNWWNIRN